MPLLRPKEVTVKTMDGDERIYIISKFPAITGREIVAGYPLTAIPKLSEYKANETVMLQLMTFVAVPRPSNAGVEAAPLQLTTKALIDNHVPDWETLIKIEYEMMKYNTSFFGKGEISTFCATMLQKALLLISPTLTPLLVRLSEAVKPRSRN